MKRREKDGAGMVDEDIQGKVNFPPHCRLIDERDDVEEGGWQEAVISGGDHLKRVLDEYGELDFECLLEEIEACDIEGCTECFKTAGERIYRVYVRHRRQNSLKSE